MAFYTKQDILSKIPQNGGGLLIHNELSARELIALSINLSTQIVVDYTPYKYSSLILLSKGMEFDKNKGTLFWGSKGGFLWEVFLKGKSTKTRGNQEYFFSKMNNG